MIRTEYYMTRNDGVRYAEAIDPTHLGREYTETDEPVVIEVEPQWPEPGEEE